MKRILVADRRAELLSTLDIILRHWGYRVLVSSRAADICQALVDTNPDLLILGPDLAGEQTDTDGERLKELLQQSKLPVIALDRSPAFLQRDCLATLATPVDLFELFAQVQRYIEPLPRRHLRLAVNLPGMVCQDKGGSQLTEVISISSRGLFIKTGFRMESNDHFRIIFPLLGMKQELDLEGRVVYRADPTPENNYRQGVGIEFVNVAENEQKALEDFLEKLLIDELADHHHGEDLDPSQLKLHSGQVLRLVKSN